MQSRRDTHVVYKLGITCWVKIRISANNLACFYRREELEFNGQRVTLELMVDMSLTEEAGTLSKFKIKSHGLQTLKIK